MGSDGLGILEFDPRHDVWSRYDWRLEAQPNAMTFLEFVDDNCLFFVSRGARFVYSRRHRTSAQLVSPLDSRLDASQHRNGSDYLQFVSPEAKRSYYAALEKEFKRLRVNGNVQQ